MPVTTLIKKALRNQPEAVRQAMRSLHTEIQIARISKRSGRLWKSLSGRTGLKVHLGCGPDIRKDWINVDLVVDNRPSLDGADGAVFINYDLRRGLPLPEGSCDYIYSSHFFEHLEYRHGTALMRDCHRALGPGGTFRIVLPDFAMAFGAYLRRDEQFFALLEELKVFPREPKETRSIVDFVNYGVYQFGEHKCIYDQEKVSLLLKSMGYRRVQETGHKPDVDPTSELRKVYSFFMEAVK